LTNSIRGWRLCIVDTSEFNSIFLRVNYSLSQSSSIFFIRNPPILFQNCRISFHEVAFELMGEFIKYPREATIKHLFSSLAIMTCWIGESPSLEWKKKTFIFQLQIRHSTQKCYTVNTVARVSSNYVIVTILQSKRTPKKPLAGWDKNHCVLKTCLNTAQRK